MKILLFCLFSLGLTFSWAQPNVVILFVDDLGYGDLGYQGNSSVETPNIDALAGEGVKFSQFLTASSICTPSRGSLLTGRLPVRLGLASNVYYQRVFQPLSPGGLPLHEHTLAEALKERGFETHLSGKWHLGIGDGGKYLPLNHGFDGFYGMGITNVQSCMPGKFVFTQNSIHEFVFFNTMSIWIGIFSLLCGAKILNLISWKSFFKSFFAEISFFFIVVFVVGKTTLLSQTMCILHQDNEIIQQPINLKNLTQRTTHDAVNFISNAESPFFLYFSFHKMHTALFSNEEFKKDGDSEYKNNLRELDWAVAQVISALKAKDQFDNTIIWFASDNGPFLERGIEGGSKSFETKDGIKTLRGGKTTIWEGGIRVPGFFVYKNLVSESFTTKEPVSSMDIFPTTLNLIDQHSDLSDVQKNNLTFTSKNPHTILDGKDLTQFLTKEQKRSGHDVMFHYCGETLSAVRLDGRFKAYLFTPKFTEPESETCKEQVACQCHGQFVQKHDPPLIFDLDNDIEEKFPLNDSDSDLNLNLILEKVRLAIEDHEKTFIAHPNNENQMTKMQQISLFPSVCCNFPICECDKDPY